VKAETEQDLLELADAVCWRPGIIEGVDDTGGRRAPGTARLFVRLLRPLRGLQVTSEEIGRAMLQALARNMRGAVVENAAIRKMARGS
jgi:hypothetical protein